MPQVSSTVSLPFSPRKPGADAADEGRANESQAGNLLVGVPSRDGLRVRGIDAGERAGQRGANRSPAGAGTGSGARRSATIWDGVFTSAQADRGQETAQAVCFACHSQSEWTNPMFIRVWSGRPIHQMWENLRMTMPYDSPGRLSAQEYSDVVAYMLELNGAPAGDTELPANADGLMQITVTPGQ